MKRRQWVPRADLSSVKAVSHGNIGCHFKNNTYCTREFSNTYGMYRLGPLWPSP
jgi:hypothetical protein